MQVCPDLNLIADFLIKKREGHRLSREIFNRLFDNKDSVFISASDCEKLTHILIESASLYSIDREYLFDAFKRLLQQVKIFSVTGASVRESIDATSFEGIEKHILYKNFKRIAPDGIIISSDKNFQHLKDVFSPEEFLNNYNRLSRTKSIPLLDLKAQYRYLLEDIDETILKTVADAKYILGPEVKELEEKISRYIGTKYCIGVASGTDALVLSLRALAIQRKGREFWDKEDLIITTPFTFTATGDSILRAGATPLFVDIDPETYNIDPRNIKDAISTYGDRVKGILPVHLYGQACEMDEIMNIAREHNLFVVEDVAQAFGGMWRGRKLGGIGDTGCFSFFPSKNLGAFGDAGAVVTNSEELFEIIRMLRVHGGRDKYNVEHIGYKARLDTIQAGVLLEKLKVIDKLNEKRRKSAEIYNNLLKDVQYIKIPFTLPDAYHVYHQYTIRVLNNHRDNLQGYLKQHGISSMIYYPVPLHKMKIFDKKSIFRNLKDSETTAMQVLSLPVDPLQDYAAIKTIETLVKEFFR